MAMERPNPHSCHLQEILRVCSEANQQQHLLLYSLGNTDVPRRITYRDLYTTALEKSRVIQTLDGFQPGLPVLLFLDDTWDTIVWFWALLIADGLPVICPSLSNNQTSRKSHLEGILGLLETPLCITRAESLPLFKECPAGLKLVTIENLDIRSVEEVRVDATPEARSHSRSENHTLCDEKGLAFLMLTSGSTGNAKAVSFTHSQVLAAVSGKYWNRPLPPGKALLNWVGLDHVASLVEIHIQAIWLGVDQVHVPASEIISSPMVFLRLLSRHHVSRTFAPNFFLAKLVSASQFVEPNAQMKEDGLDLSKLTVLASGGEPNHVKTCISASDLLKKYGAPSNVITPGFGMTETCAGAIFSLECPSADIRAGRSVAALGKCIEGIEMRVTSDSGSDTNNLRLEISKDPGHLELRGPIVFKGYYNNAKATAEAFTSDGWFRTGDQAAIDSEGCLRLLGRYKDVMNIKGVKIDSSDIQIAIEDALGGLVARVIAFPSSTDHTEQITVAYAPKDGSHNLAVEDMAKIDDLVVQTCIMTVGSRPVVFSLREQSITWLPMSSLGKVSRAKMRSMFETGAFAADLELHMKALMEHKKCNRQASALEATASEPTEIEQSLLLAIPRVLENIVHDTIDLDTSFFDLGITSIGLIRLKNLIDVQFRTTVQIVMLMKNPTARSLAAALRDIGVADETYDPVVELRSHGDKTPLWLVHPGVGEVLVFMGLAQHLEDDRPIYALRARGFEPGQRTFSSINEAVDTYVAAIRQRQHRGPYALAGYSYGAMLAFEMAKRMTDVRFLGSFNLPPHIKMRMRHLNWNLCLLHLASFLGLILDSDATSIEETMEFRAASRARAHAAVTAASDVGRMAELGLSEQGLAGWADVAYSLQSMAIDYEPSGEVEGMDIFHAEPLKIAAASREEWIREHLSKWADFCRSQPRFHHVGGAHYTMIGPDHVCGFVAKLKAALCTRGL